jgi:hypothetical protein
MAEYLIRRTDGDWFDLLPRQYSEALRPSSHPIEQVAGWGDYRIRMHGAEIAFSFEDPGIQVIIEGELGAATADTVVAQICQNIERVTGQKGRAILLRP